MKKLSSVLLVVLLFCMSLTAATASKEGRRNTRNLALGVLAYGLIKDNDTAKTVGVVGTVLAEINLRDKDNNREDYRYRDQRCNRDRDYDYRPSCDRDRRFDHDYYEQERLRREDACRRAEIERLNRERQLELERQRNRERELARQRHEHERQHERDRVEPPRRWNNDQRSDDRCSNPRYNKDSVRVNWPVIVISRDQNRNHDRDDRKENRNNRQRRR
ncbi:MAG: hypothetical protein WCV58_03500 [Patescibacteria group bacterium]